MKTFSTHTGLVVPLERDNVDTDAIMPKQFMKSIARTGFGSYVFDEWRFVDAGFYGKPAEDRKPRPEFVLNLPRYADATVLLCGRNFGCGSSREHAPWALQQAGFRVLIARSFADIFQNNCCKNGLLPITLREQDMSVLFREVVMTTGFTMTVDLGAQTVKGTDGCVMHFDIEPSQKRRLLEGSDEISETLKTADAISEFEAGYFRRKPWL
jgi:3-isopropylmalate/(R)-2-methylmalate dehydratase small subunit